MWVKRPGLPPWLFHYLKTFWTWLFIMGVKQTAWIRISPYIHRILLFKWAIQRSKKWLVCSDRNHFWNIICSFWMPKISFPALLPILSGEEEGNVRNRSHFFSPLSASLKKQIDPAPWKHLVVILLLLVFLFSHFYLCWFLFLNW